MADSIHIDTTDLLALTADMTKAAGNVGPFVKKAVTVTAVNVKNDWRQPLKGSPTVPRGYLSVSFDITPDDHAMVIAAEVGPVLNGGGGQGPVVGMLEYGTPTIGPTGYGAAALKKNERDFEKGLSFAAGDALKEANL